MLLWTLGRNSSPGSSGLRHGQPEELRSDLGPEGARLTGRISGQSAEGRGAPGTEPHGWGGSTVTRPFCAWRWPEWGRGRTVLPLGQFL